MAKFFKLLLKFLLVLLIWALICGAVYGVVVHLLDKPLQLCIMICSGLFGVWLVYVTIRKIIAVVHARKRVQALIQLGEQGTVSELEEANLNLTAEHFRNRLTRFIRLLKRTKLRRQGNPLYVLPWYLITGRKDMGLVKTIENARLAQPHLQDDDFLRGEDASIYPYSEAVAISVPNHSLEGRQEERYWTQLLHSIKTHRKKEPINGIVMNVSYGSIVSKNEDELFESGRKNIAQIHHAISVLQYKVPLYLMITGCEDMEGFAQFADSLPEEARDQPMGCVNYKNSENSIRFVLESFDSIIESVHSRVLKNINDSRADVLQVALTLRISELKEKLKNFLDGAFKDNPYQDAPVLKGVYFSGVVGASESGRKKNKEKNSSAEKDKRGLFLHDFFTQVLPSDRHIELVPAYARKLDQRRMAFRSAWIFVVLCCAGFLYYKFDLAQTYLNRVKKDKAGKFVMADSFKEDMSTLYEYYDNLRRVEEDVYGWGVPQWLGYTGSPAFIEQMKKTFVSRYKLNVYEKIKGRENADFHELFGSFTGKEELDETKKILIATYIEVCVRKINYLNGYLKYSLLNDTREKFACFELRDPTKLGLEEEPEFVKLNKLQNTFLRWGDDKVLLERELVVWRERFNRLLKVSDRVMSWVEPMVSSRMDEPVGYSLEKYWPGVGQLPTKYDIPSIYTITGINTLQEFLKSLEEVNTEAELFAKLQENFWKKYNADYIKAWSTFAMNFNEGSSSLQGREDWLTMLDMIGSTRNPYFSLLDDMAENLQPFFEVEDLPDWIGLLKYYEDMLAHDPNYDAKAAKKKNKVFAKLALGAVKTLGPAGKAVAKVAQKGMKINNKLATKPGIDELLTQTGAALGEFRKALYDVPFKATDRENSYQAMYNLFSNPESPGKGADTAAKVVAPLETLMRLIGKETVRSEPFWRVMKGPVPIIRHFMVLEAAEEIQQKWQMKVLVPIQNTPEYKRIEMLHSPTGLLQTFLGNDIKPFISQTVKGNFLPVLVDGTKMPFYSEFFNLLARSRDLMLSQPAQGRYEVRIVILPITCNLDAAKLPSKLNLTLKGSMGEPQVLTSTVFNNVLTFLWGDASSDFTLEIQLGDVFLKKNYPGQRGFAYFLKEFEFGSHRFSLKDFPDQAEAMKSMNVTHIDVSFDLNGHGEVIKVLDQNPEILPQKIISGW